MRPAVSVGSLSAAVDDSIQRSVDQLAEPGVPGHIPHNVASPLSDNGFSRLFSPGPAIGADLPFLENGLSDLNGGNGLGGDTFPFDTLVDFDADQPFVDFGGNHNHTLAVQSCATHLSDQLAATTTGLQPSFGAPLEGSDGQGIAADV